jgi:hypothetical protein
MPIISRFFGIVVSMYFGDHAPPHIHVKYGEYTASVTLAALQILEGRVPQRVYAMVLEWMATHRDELWTNWQRAQDGLPLNPVEPLE